VFWVFRAKGSDDLSFNARKVHGVLSIVKERFPDDWHPFRDDFLPDDDRVRTNFPLCMFIHSQMEKVEQIVEINLPVRFGICREREILPRLLAGNASRYARLIYCARLFL
jgi:hypothetical protein